MENCSLTLLRYQDVFKIISTFHLYFLPISLIVNSTTLFVIFSKTPSTFGTIKHFFRVNQILNLICDVVMSGIIQPAPFYPYCCVAVLGPVKYFLDRPIIGYAIIFFLVLISVSAAIGMLFYRYQSILGKKSIFTKESHILITIASVCVLLGINIIIAISIGETSSESREKTFLPTHPSFQIFFTFKNTYADGCMPNYVYLIITLCISEAVLITWGVYSIVGCLKTLSITSDSISCKTRKLQKKFTICLLIQFAIPLCMIGFPCSYIITTIVFSICNSWTWIFNVLAYLAISAHSIMFSIITLLVTDSYRTFLFPCTKKKAMKKLYSDRTTSARRK